MRGLYCAILRGLFARNFQSVNTTYTATGTNTAGCVGSATQAIVVNANPTVAVANGTICSGDSFTLSPTGATSYTYSTGPVVTPVANSSYTITGSNAAGCTNSVAATVSVNTTPTVSIASTNTTICSGSTATLTASGASTYLWNTSATTTVITVTPSANTSYTVTGANGTCTNSAVQSVSVNTTPTVNAVSSLSLICNGQSATLTASGANTYSWNTTATTTVISVSPTVTTSYTVTGTTNGCSNTFVVSQAVSPCTGINANSTALSGLLVYPNPNTGEFTIELNNGSVKNIDVMDLTGRVVISNTSSNDKVDFNINTLANGVYYVRIQSNNTVEIIKIVKQ